MIKKIKLISRWDNLLTILHKICFMMGWLSPVLIALNTLALVLSDNNYHHQKLIWLHLIPTVWLALFLISYFYRKLKYFSYATYLACSVALLGLYIWVLGDVNNIVAAAILCLLLNCLLNANLMVLFVNIVAFELVYCLVILNGAEQVKVEIVFVLAMMVYLITMLVLVLRSFDNKIPTPKLTLANNSRTDNFATTLINGIEDSVFRLDSELKITLYNMGSLLLLNATTSLMTQKIDDVIHLQLESGEAVDFRALIKDTKTPTVYEDLLWFSQDQTKILQITVLPIKNAYGVAEDYEYIILIKEVTDATNQKHHQQKFIETVVNQLGDALTKINIDLSKTKDILKTTQADLVIKNNLVKSKADVIKLTGLVDNLQTLSQATSQETIKLTKIDFKQLCYEIFKYNQLLADEKNVKLDLKIDAGIRNLVSHANYLKEILQRLLNYSFEHSSEAIDLEIKYVPTGIKVTVNSVESDPRQTIHQDRGTNVDLMIATNLLKKIGSELKINHRPGFGTVYSFILLFKSK